MQKIGIDERTHALICDYVDGNLDESKKYLLEKIASKSKSIRDLIDDSQYTKRILVQYNDELLLASLK